VERTAATATIRKTMRRGTLRRAARINPRGLLRLARFLRLRVEGMSPRQVANLVYWRITRDGYRR